MALWNESMNSLKWRRPVGFCYHLLFNFPKFTPGLLLASSSIFGKLLEITIAYLAAVYEAGKFCV